MFLDNIEFNRSVVFDVSRDTQREIFKTKVIKYKREVRTKPTTDFRKCYKPFEYIDDSKEVFTLFKKGYKLHFKDNLTIIVGDNGCGKSTLFKYIKIRDFFFDLPLFKGKDFDEKEYYKRQWGKYINDDDRKLTFNETPSNIIYLDDISKGGNIKMFNKAIPELTKKEHIIQYIDMNNFSNGEHNHDIFSMLGEIKNSLLILDEPETSLSIKSIIKLKIKIMELAVNNQVIIITHNEHLMRILDEVYDLESKKYINTEKYIKSQLK